MRKRLAVATAAIAALAAGGIAYAAIPDGGGMYTACELNGVGTIRLIDPSLSAKSLLSHCTALETQVSWNQKGQTGAPGAPGAPGTAGPKGDAGVSPTVAQLGAGNSHCASGGAAITDASGSTAYVCNGTNGADGTNGGPSPARSPVRTASTRSRSPTRASCCVTAARGSRSRAVHSTHG